MCSLAVFTQFDWQREENNTRICGTRGGDGGQRKRWRRSRAAVTEAVAEVLPLKFGRPTRRGLRGVIVRCVCSGVLEQIEECCGLRWEMELEGFNMLVRSYLFCRFADDL